MRTLSVVVLAILLMGAALPESTVSDAAHTFSVKVPQGWSSSWKGGTLRLVAPPYHHIAFRSNVGIEVMDGRTSLTPKHKKEFREQLKALMPHLEITGESDGIVAGAPGWKITYSGVTHDVHINGCSIVFYRNQHTWIFTFLTSEQAWDQDKPGADTVLDSFTIL